MKSSLVAFSFLLVTFSFAQPWSQMGSDILGEAAQDIFGVWVALSDDGETIIIGAQYNDGGGSGSGSARVYEWNGTDWTQKGGDLDGEASNDNAGISVDISSNGNTVIVGAFQNDGNGVDAGSARAYEWNGSAWIQKGADIDGEAAGDLCGISVSISADGNTVAVGSHNNDNTAFAAGSTRIFEWNGSAWLLKGASINGEAFGDNAGFCVSLNDAGTRVAIGARSNDDGGSNAGHTRIYDWSGSAWIQVGIDIDGQAIDDQSGYSLHMNGAGDKIVIGEPRHNGAGADDGQVRNYEWSGSAWVQFGPTLDADDADDRFGHSVAMNGAGDRIVVGADKSDTVFFDAGEARVFDYYTGSWSQIGQTFVGTASEDWLGTSVDISGDGTTIAIGAPNDDQGGTNAGAVRIYKDCFAYAPDTALTWSNWTLSSNQSGAQYQWIDCDNGNSPISGETNQSFEPSSNGNYAVIISDGICQAQSACFLVEGLSIQDQLIHLIKVYPNPTSEDVIIDLGKTQKHVEIELYNTRGQLVLNDWFHNSSWKNFYMDVENGLYFMKIKVDGVTVYYNKIIKN